MSNSLTTPKPARSRIAAATRVAAGAGVTVATLTFLGGTVFASGDEPIPGPILDPEFTPELEIEFTPDPLGPEPSIPVDIEIIPEIPVDFPELPELPEPEDDGPEIEIIPDFPLDIPDLPELPEPDCEPWNPADLFVSSFDNGDLTATVTLIYAVPTGVCDELFVVHSVQEDAAWTPIVLLAEEHVTIADLYAEADHEIAVVVPLDPCNTRVFTHGPEALLMQDDHYGTGCPPDETLPDPTVPDPTVPDPTVPQETTPQTNPTVPPTTPTSVPGGTLPQTGSSATTVIALLGGALVLAGATLAIGVRKSQRSGY